MRKIYSAILLLLLSLAGSRLSAQINNEKVISGLVRQHAFELKISAEDVDNAKVSHTYLDEKTNIRYVYLQQTYQGIKVYNSIMTIIFRDNEILYSSGKFVDHVREKTGNSQGIPSLQAGQAIGAAATHLGLPAPSGLVITENKFNAEKKINFSAAGLAKEKIETELLWVASDDGSSVKLAWNVNIDEKRSSDWWNVRMDANTGEYLEKNNFTVYDKWHEDDPKMPKDNSWRKVVSDISGEYVRLNNKPTVGLKQFAPPTVTNATYFVSAHPSESPRHNPMVTETNPWLKAGVGNNAATNGWHFDGTNNYDITRGNNVHAYLDVANTNNPASATNLPATSTTAIPSLTFGTTPNFNQQPNTATNRQAAVTNLFYWNNIIHDVLYQYNFNEVFGNFQADNIGRGGVAGSDYVQAEAQDAGGTNNANFGTPADGQRPRMQMFLWSGVPLFRVNTPGNIAADYFAAESGFSTNNQLTNVGPVTGQVVWYNDNGLPSGTHFACTGSTPGPLTGKIAMIIRGGGCLNGFIEKVKNAQNAGAIAVVMVNNVGGLPITMGGADNTITIPAVMISQNDGAILAAELANNVNITMSAGVPIDGDFDNGVVTHEYGHGVSNRLTGGAPNAGCLNNTEQGGEGWSDYLGLMLTQNWATTNLTDGSIPRPIGVYALGHPLGQGGIRTAPYSTNLAVSPQTYTAMPTMAVPHGIGEIWCSALWDMTWNIIQQEGSITPSIYTATGTGGNIMALKLVMEGMRLQTCRPGFLDGRDAILAADSIMFNGRHKCAIWRAFARRGMGFSASQGSSNSVTDGTAAFDVPSSVRISKTAAPLTVVQGEQVAIKANVTCECQINTNYVLRDTIPAGFNYVSSNGGTLSGNIVTFSPVNFTAEQESKLLTINLTPANAGCALTNAINDNRDGSTTGGLTSVIATGAVNWVPSTVRSSSPTTSWFAGSTAATKDFSLTSPSPGFAAGSLSIFSFKQYFITENTLDGGRVEYSTDNGANWIDAQALILQNGYNGVASAAPWGAGQRIWTGVSFGRVSGQFIQTIVNLSSLSGQNVRVRIRARSSAANAATYEGWYVDDILQMDGCGGIVKSGMYNGSSARVDSLYTPVFIKSGTPVSFVVQPTDKTGCNGSSVTFTAGANAAVSPTYQWQLSTDGGTTYNDIAGQTGTTLTVTPLTLAMNGYKYRVIAYSSLSSGFVISNPVTLTVNPIPNAVSAPATQTICSGTAITPMAITGSVAGTVFNWVRNNTANVTGIAASGSGISISGLLTNTTTAQQTVNFTITPSYTNNGVTCTGTPFVASVIVEAPLGLTCPANMTVNAAAGTCAANVTFAATVTGTPAATVTYTPASGSSFPVGTTTVNVSANNVCGSRTCSFTVTVLDVQIPNITTQPANRTVCLGTNAVFSVVSTFGAAYQWEAWNGTAWVAIPGANASTYQVNNVTHAMNTNSFRVTITGPCGTPRTSTHATLYVNPLPVVSISSNVAPQLLPNQPIILTANVNIPGGSYVWFKNNVVIPGATSSTFGPLDVLDAASYKVTYTDPNGCVNTSPDFFLRALLSNNMYIYPVPNNGQFHIRFYNEANAPAIVTVYNELGAVVFAKTYTTGALRYSIIDVDLGKRIASGTYMVDMRNTNGVRIGVKRIIVGQE